MVKSRNQLGLSAEFADEPIRTHRALIKHGLRVGSKENNFCRGPKLRTYLLGSLNAVHSWHLNVEQNNIRVQLSDLLYSLFPVTRFAANIHG